MPYLEEADKERLLTGDPPRSAGELNYLLTWQVVRFLAEQPHDNYEARNAAIGALEAAKLELYRRDVAVYEDWKRDINGDVYPRPPVRPRPKALPIMQQKPSITLL